MVQDDLSPVIELTRSGPLISGSVSPLRRRFASQHCVVLKGLLSPPLLDDVQRHAERAQWQDGHEYTSGTGTVLTSKDSSGPAALHFLLNNPDFVKFVASVTGCDEISEFRFGAIYRMLPTDQHQLSWHDDLNKQENRQVGLSLNLSRNRFEGGAFELREHLSKEPVAHVCNTGSGDALLFRVSKEFEHRVTPIAGTMPKTAFTGWFCATGDTHLTRLVTRLKQHGA